MVRLVYQFGIWVYYLGVRIASAWNPKAAAWIRGRKGWRKQLEGRFSGSDKVVWFHCASLGEFEQGRPLMETIRREYPAYRILLTFFSPSGYEKRKNFGGADLVMYLPLDTQRGARVFLDLVPVEYALFIKYELWYHFLVALKRRNVPAYLVSAHFTSSQLFFRWYGGWYRKFLSYFEQIFVQERGSEELLREHGIERVTVAGDTRFDRVTEISRNGREYPPVGRFAGGRPVVIAGSTWEKDEEQLGAAYERLRGECRWIIAPHEPTAEHVARLKEQFPGAVLFSAIEGERDEQADVLIVDTVGHLSSLYRYGTIAWIGGGFGRGIHNILEATAAGLPVIFGPHYQRFREAVELVNAGAAFVVREPGAGFLHIRELLGSPEMLKSVSQTAKNYTFNKTGATRRIVDYVFKNIG